MGNAHEAARNNLQRKLYPENMLDAIIHTQCDGRTLLEQLYPDLERLSLELQGLCRKNHQELTRRSPRQRMPLSTSSADAYRGAFRESHVVQHWIPGTEFLLCAIVKLREPSLRRFLRRRGITPRNLKPLLDAHLKTFGPESLDWARSDKAS